MSDRLTREDLSTLPAYRSHKTVRALKISQIERHSGVGEATIHPVETDYAPFRVSAAYMERHKPEVGGYFVAYDDGYESWSPAQAFEEGYTRI